MQRKRPRRKLRGESRHLHPLVAVVEDDAGLRAAIQSLLNSSGFDTTGFPDAKTFLQSRGWRDLHCLILDLQLPGMSGLDLQRHLLDRALQIPIVFITGEADPDGNKGATALRAGAVAFLRKPFDDEDLLNALRTACARHR